jgi:hypothetical protein
MIEALFGYGAGNRSNAKDKELAMPDPSPQHVSLLDFKKSCNLAVVFKAMNVRVEDIQNALTEGSCYSFFKGLLFTGHVARLFLFICNFLHG